MQQNTACDRCDACKGMDCLRHIATQADVDRSLDVELPQELSVEPDSYDSDHD